MFQIFSKSYTWINYYIIMFYSVKSYIFNSLFKKIINIIFIVWSSRSLGFLFKIPLRYSKYPLVNDKIFPAEGRIFFRSLKSSETFKNRVFGAEKILRSENYSKYPLVNYNLETRGFLNKNAIDVVKIVDSNIGRLLLDSCSCVW